MARRVSTRSAQRQADNTPDLRALFTTGKPADHIDLIAIDPGDQHVGVAFFQQNTDGMWFCVDAIQIDDPDQFELDLAETLLTAHHPMTVVYERFRLYEDKARQQKGSEFRTSQMIGAIGFIVRMRETHRLRHVEADAAGKMMSCELTGGTCADLPFGPPTITIFGQVADIKKPTTGILRFKKIKSVGRQNKKDNPGWGDHCVDAELHGWKYILDELKAEAAPGF